VNSLVAAGQWWRLATAALVHGGLLHLAGNMLAVHYLGPPVEHELGRTGFLSLYVFSAVAGGLAHYAYYWHGLLGGGGVLWGGGGPTVLGSSGAIAGLFAAWVVHRLRNRGVLGWSSADTSYVAQMVLLNAGLAWALSGSLAHTCVLLFARISGDERHM
jgi:membrane associated rhomboid family serine protease